MEIVETGIKGLVVLEPKVFGDVRGYFFESYNKSWFSKNVSEVDFVQDNESRSSRGVLRGLHFQRPPYDQAKLVRVIEGEVMDVVVDLRSSSPTYGNIFQILLSAENKKQLFVPRGFAHGFSVLSPSAIFSYKVDNDYNVASEGGINWKDETLGIDWKLDENEIQLSEKDKHLPDFLTFKSPF